MPEHIINGIGKAISQARDILLVSHIRPDGDAVGSLLGLGFSLQAAGKRVQMVLNDGVPRGLRFLPGSEQVQKKIQAPYDLSIVLDCSDLQRTGHVLADEPRPDINIDHHPTNLHFAHLNLVESHAVATAEILTRYIPPAAPAIYTEATGGRLTCV